MIDIERIVSDHLRTDDDVQARVVGSPPSDHSTSWVQVVQLNASQAPNDPADHLIPFYLQFSCYAGAEGGQPEANRLGWAVRKSLLRLNGSQNDATVTAVRINGDSRIPDTTFEQARERRILTATVWAHA